MLYLVLKIDVNKSRKFRNATCLETVAFRNCNKTKPFKTVICLFLRSKLAADPHVVKHKLL